MCPILCRGPRCAGGSSSPVPVVTPPPPGPLVGLGGHVSPRFLSQLSRANKCASEFRKETPVNLGSGLREAAGKPVAGPAPASAWRRRSPQRGQRETATGTGAWREGGRDTRASPWGLGTRLRLNATGSLQHTFCLCGPTGPPRKGLKPRTWILSRSREKEPGVCRDGLPLEAPGAVAPSPLAGGCVSSLCLRLQGAAPLGLSLSSPASSNTCHWVWGHPESPGWPHLEAAA